MVTSKNPDFIPTAALREKFLAYISNICGAALTLGLRGGGVLVSLLVLPLCIPVLIFGAGAVEAVASGMNVASHLSLLGALLLLALVFTPWVTAQALRISME